MNMDSEWSRRESVVGCLNCRVRPEQVAIFRTGGLIFRLCIDCVNLLHDATMSLIDDYDGYDDDNE